MMGTIEEDDKGVEAGPAFGRLRIGYLRRFS